jgi:hypothetical protein
MSARTTTAAAALAVATALALGAGATAAGAAPASPQGAPSGSPSHASSPGRSAGGPARAVARPAPAANPRGPWRDPRHRPRRGGWRDYVLAPSNRQVAPESVLRASPRDGAIDGDPSAALRQDGRAVTLRSSGDRTRSPLLALDFGQEVGGHLRVKLTGVSDPAPKLHACFSESQRYRALGDRNSGQAAFAPGCDTANIWVGFPGQPYTYDADSHTLDIPATLPGDATDRTLRGGFRYVTLFLDGPGSVSIDAVSVDFTPEPARADPSKLQGWFDSSDELLNKIWAAGAYTVQMDTDTASTAKSWPYNAGERDHADGQLSGLSASDEVIYDGAKRDRLVWQGDLAVQGPVTYLSTWDLPAIGNSLTHLAAQQLPDGFVPGSSQMGQHNADEERTYGEYVEWFVNNMADHYRYTGDLAYLRAQWPAIERAAGWLESVRRQDSQGLIGFGAVNACGHYGYSDCGHETYLNALYARNLDQLATMARALGDDDAAAAYAARAVTVRRAIDSQLWDDDAGAYRLSRETPNAHPQDGNAMAVLAGVATPARAQRALAFLRANTWARYGSLTVSPDEPGGSLSPFYAPLPSGFEAQARFGVPGDARGIGDATSLQLIRRFWGHQLQQDPHSTFVEHLQPDGSTNLGQFSSLAHGWASAPTTVLTQDVLGVTPATPGYATFDVAPHPADLRWAEGAVPTPHGTIRSDWSRSGDDLTVHVTAPRGTSGDASLPTFGRTVQLRVDGRLVWNGRRALAAGVRRDGDRIVVEGLARGAHTLRSHAIGAPARTALSQLVTPAAQAVSPGDTVALKLGVTGVAHGDLAGTISASASDADWQVSPASAAFDKPSAGAPVVAQKALYVVVPDDAGAGERTVTVRARTRDGVTATATARLSITRSSALFAFEDGTDGWSAGDNVVSVARVGSFANGPGKPSEGSGALEATAASVPADTPKRVFVTPAAPLDLTADTEIHAMVDGYGGAPGATGYEATLTLTGAGGETRSTTVAIQSDAWNRVSLDLTGWAARSAVSRITVSFRATGSSTVWQPRFQVDDVGVTGG